MVIDFMLLCNWESRCDVMAHMLNCDIIVSRFELQSRYYVHFQTKTFEKDMNSLILRVIC